MYKKRLPLLALACLVSLSSPLFAQETTPEAAAVEAEAQSTVEEAEPASEAPEALDESAYSAMQERWRERDARYEDLKQRAREAGVMLPEDPPWKSTAQGEMPAMNERMQRHQAMMQMTPQERMAAREESYREMQARARERGIEMPETTPWEARRALMEEEWAKHQAVIEGMSDEERAACHAMHRRHMEMMLEMSQRRHMRGYGMGPGAMQPGWGSGMMDPGYGYGYGPNPYAPKSFWGS